MIDGGGDLAGGDDFDIRRHVAALSHINQSSLLRKVTSH